MKTSCPPCTGACTQGRACPARIEAAQRVETFPLNFRNFALAVAIAALAFGLSFIGA